MVPVGFTLECDSVTLNEAPRESNQRVDPTRSLVFRARVVALANPQKRAESALTHQTLVGLKLLRNIPFKFAVSKRKPIKMV